MLRASPGVLRHTLLSALGLLPLACGGSSTSSPGAGGSSPSAGTGGTSGSGGQAIGGGGLAAAGSASAAGAGGVTTAGTGGVNVAGSSGSAGAGGAVTPPFPCEGSVSLAGASPGYAKCGESGVWHRPQIVDCPPSQQEQPVPGDTGCSKDEDCGEGKICVCGQRSLCADATCSRDADCMPGFVCRGYSTTICDGPGEVLPNHFACQTATDVCFDHRECEGGIRCGAESGTFKCDVNPVSLACGRPFLVQGAARIANVQSRTDWAAAPFVVDDTPLGAAACARAGQEWARIAQLEHASIAAFARFTLQLLQLGAPAELVERASRAMQDETRHAQLAFALASRYLDEPLGPAPLDVGHSLDDGSLSAVVRLAFREGCVGETVAALQVQEAAAHTEGELRAALLQVAREEAEHAELAWRFVRWALTKDAALVRVLHDELARALAEPVSEGARHDADDLLAFGILSRHVELEVRRAALRDVVKPCALALLSPAPQDASERVAASSHC